MSTKLTTEQFIQKAKEVHGTKYNYSLSEYINNKTKVKIVCHEHGIFEQTPTNHIHCKQGCLQCGHIITIASRKLTTEQFIQKAKEVHGTQYDYSLVEYKGIFTPILIQCSTHGIFEQTPDKHLNRMHGCPKCNSSKGETKIRLWLEQNNILFKEQKRFSDCRSKIPLPFDFYLPQHNCCIEFDGEQHFKLVNWSSNEQKNIDKLHRTKLHDTIRETYCKEQNIKLVRIPYYEYPNITIILANELL